MICYGIWFVKAVASTKKLLNDKQVLPHVLSWGTLLICFNFNFKGVIMYQVKVFDDKKEHICTCECDNQKHAISIAKDVIEVYLSGDHRVNWTVTICNEVP